MATHGTCKWFDSKKGIGFIAKADGSGDIFVHQSSINAENNVFRKLMPGEACSFDVAQDQEGREKAVGVTYNQEARDSYKRPVRKNRSK